MKKINTWLSVMVFFSVFMILVSLSGQEIDVKKEDGIQVVYNPLNPVKSLDSSFNMILKEDLVIGSSGKNSDYNFEIIGDIKADDNGNIYVVDEQAHSILVFNKDGNYLKDIGRKGEGPGEFMYPSEMAISADKIVVYSGFRISYFTLKGDFINFKKVMIMGRSVFDSAGNIISQFPGPPKKGFLSALTKLMERISISMILLMKRACT